MVIIKIMPYLCLSNGCVADVTKGYMLVSEKKVENRVVYYRSCRDPKPTRNPYVKCPRCGAKVLYFLVWPYTRSRGCLFCRVLDLGHVA